MAVAVETLEKLERKMTLNLPLNTIQSEVTARLKSWRAPSRWTVSVQARSP
jgi:FKBP-type peptidyl-prolyl cis-trans isomerase (trigger factor)